MTLSFVPLAWLVWAWAPSFAAGGLPSPSPPERVEVIRGVSRGLGTRLAAAGDGNGDGYDDVAVGSWASGVSVFHGGPDGPDPKPWATLVQDRAWIVTGPGDVDGDGDGYLDLASSRRVSGVSVFTGGADGFAQDPTFVLDDALPGVAYGVALDLGGDMDADGLSEMVVGAGWDPDQEGGASPGPN